MPVWTVCRLCRASTPTIVAISWISVLVSFALVEEERSLLNFARRQGCDETWTLDSIFLSMFDSYTDVGGSGGLQMRRALSGQEVDCLVKQGMKIVG